MKKSFRQRLGDFLVRFEDWAISISIGVTIGGLLDQHFFNNVFGLWDWVIVLTVFLIGVAKPVTTERKKHGQD